MVGLFCHWIFIGCIYLSDEGKSQNNSLQNNHSSGRKEAGLNFRRISQNTAVLRASQWHLSKPCTIRAIHVEKVDSLGAMTLAKETVMDDN